MTTTQWPFKIPSNPEQAPRPLNRDLQFEPETDAFDIVNKEGRPHCYFIWQSRLRADRKAAHVDCAISAKGRMELLTDWQIRPLHAVPGRVQMSGLSRGHQ